MATAAIAPSQGVPPPAILEPGMELTVHRDVLLAELAVSHGVTSGSNSIVPILTNLRLEAGNGRLTISATNLEESVRTSLPAQVKKEGAATVPARKFFEYVRLLPRGNLSLKVLPNAWVQINSGRSRTKMLGMDQAQYPAIPSAGELPKLSLPTGVLRAMIPRVLIAVSSAESRYTLNGALLNLQSNLLTMVATDGHRLAKLDARVTIDGVDAERSMLIPGRALTALIHLLAATAEPFVTVAEDGSKYYFGIGDRHFSTRKLSGTFPNYKAVLPQGPTNQIILPVAEFEKSLRRVVQFADEKSGAVKLSLGSDTLKINSRCVERGESEDTIEAPYTQAAITIGFNAELLLEFLKSIAGEKEVRLELKDGGSAAVLRPEGSLAAYSYLYVLMPMRV